MIKAIETSYAGCRFRSRLEARWAVFFDALGIPWEYEPEAFSLPSGGYLPDFRIGAGIYPAVPSCWIEVKPSGDEGTADPRWVQLAEASRRPVLVTRGMPRPDRLAQGYFQNGLEIYAGEETADIDYYFCACPYCEHIGIAFEGRWSRMCPEHLGVGRDNQRSYDHYGILAAYTLARSARFEPARSNVGSFLRGLPPPGTPPPGMSLGSGAT